jgi:hypothetical protein
MCLVAACIKGLPLCANVYFASHCLAFSSAVAPCCCAASREWSASPVHTSGRRLDSGSSSRPSSTKATASSFAVLVSPHKWVRALPVCLSDDQLHDCKSQHLVSMVCCCWLPSCFSASSLQFVSNMWPSSKAQATSYAFIRSPQRQVMT